MNVTRNEPIRASHERPASLKLHIRVPSCIPRQISFVEGFLYFVVLFAQILEFSKDESYLRYVGSIISLHLNFSGSLTFHRSFFRFSVDVFCGFM